mgnify:CR=1 FL=1
MSDMKKLFPVFAAVAALSNALFAQSATDMPELERSQFSMAFADVVFFSPQEVIRAYSGNWGGSQTLSVAGNAVSSAVVEQNYHPAHNAADSKLIGSGKIIGGGSTIPTRSYMYVEDGALRLDIITMDNVVVPYIGIIEYSRITWLPRSFCFSYDVQTDTFQNSPDGVKIETVGMKFVSAPKFGFEGFLEINSVLVKGENVYSAGRVNTSRRAQFDFPKSKMQD